MTDAHCHLQDPQLLPRLETVLADAQAAGVDTYICAAGNLANSRQAIALAESHPGIWATVGVYPEEPFPPDLLRSLTRLARHPKVVAVGETGLNYTSGTSAAEKTGQMELLEIHLEVSILCQLPVVVHCRKAFEEVYQMINARRKKLVGVQMHCFTGQWQWAERFLGLDCYLSFGGIVTFKNSHYLREVARLVPEDRLLIETDSPWLPPEPLRGTVNLPQNVKIVAAALAHIRGTSIDQIARTTDANTKRLFLR